MAKSYDEMTDEEFLALDGPLPEEKEKEEETPETPSAEEEETPSPESSDKGQDESEAEEEDTDESEEESDGNQEPNQGNADPHAGDGKPTSDDTSEGKVQTPAQEKKPEDKPAAKADAPADGSVNTKEALEFYKIITTPFKADGKDFTVRSAEDAVRLIQQGVNYSRRMHELKPMRQIHRMLEDHGLADTNKLSFLIDIQKGNVDAIKKLIKDKGIDYLDLDTDSENQYQTRSYAGNTADNTFRDVLDEAVKDPDGQVILDNIHQTWDQQSKEQLRTDPSILGNLMQQRRDGYYDKILEELQYQRTMGYLLDVPFLAAYDQVGLAMKNAGLFDAPKPEQTTSMGELRAQAPTTPQSGQPVASGVRKERGNEEPTPNPHLSSKPPATPGTGSRKTVTDYGNLSDEEMRKLPPPI